MIIKVPMDEELYDAALKVMETIEEKLIRAGPRETDEEILGRSTAEAYRRWQALVLAKYARTPTEWSGSIVMSIEEPTPVPTPAMPEVDEPEIKLDGRRHNRPARPPGRNHPWRTKPKLKP